MSKLIELIIFFWDSTYCLYTMSALATILLIVLIFAQRPSRRRLKQFCFCGLFLLAAISAFGTWASKEKQAVDSWAREHAPDAPTFDEARERFYRNKQIKARDMLQNIKA